MPLISARRRFSGSSPAVHVGGGGGAAAPFALDGSAAGNQPGGTTVSATLTTTQTNDIIIACTLNNSASASPPTTSIADTSGLTWTLLADVFVPAAHNQPITAYYAKSSGILTSDVITVTCSQSTFQSLHVFAVSGANFTTPLDSNGALPGTAIGTGTTFTLTTTAANTFMFGSYRMNSVEFPTAGATWTTIKGQDYLLTEYKIVTSTQSGVTAPVGTGSGDQSKGVGHAIVKA